MSAPPDISGTAWPMVASDFYKPSESSTCYAVCPSCKTLYLGVVADALICCRRHVTCVQAGDTDCIDIMNECPVEFAYRVVDRREPKSKP